VLSGHSIRLLIKKESIILRCQYVGPLEERAEEGLVDKERDASLCGEKLLGGDYGGVGNFFSHAQVEGKRDKLYRDEIFNFEKRKVERRGGS